MFQPSQKLHLQVWTLESTNILCCGVKCPSHYTSSSFFCFCFFSTLTFSHLKKTLPGSSRTWNALQNSHFYVACHFGSQKLKTLKASLLTSSGSLNATDDIILKGSVVFLYIKWWSVLSSLYWVWCVYLCAHGDRTKEMLSALSSGLMSHNGWSLESTTSDTWGSLMLDQFKLSISDLESS